MTALAVQAERISAQLLACGLGKGLAKEIAAIAARNPMDIRDSTSEELAFVKRAAAEFKLSGEKPARGSTAALVQ